MKTIKLFFALSVFAIVLTSCEPELTSDSVTVSTIVDFENVKLNVDSIWNGSDGSGFFTTKVATFNNSYNAAWFSWSGFACSAKKNKTTPGYTNQYSVSAGSGASGSKQFALAYGAATLQCDSNVYGNFSIKSLMLTNSTYAYLDMMSGTPGVSKKFVAGDWFKVTITGYLNNINKSAVDYYLSDFRDGKTFMSNTWNKVDVSSLGKVDQVTFTFDSSDKGQWGMNTPAYVCIDNIEFTQTISTK
ncbi:MAG: DUF4465 domain-containing protein [Paludibacter sp.]|nr:DUF4465 domain-containing protein [Paludibacter sp.]